MDYFLDCDEYQIKRWLDALTRLRAKQAEAAEQE